MININKIRAIGGQMKRKILSWSLVIIWMGLIFYFSHQPATESSELSSGITEVIVDMVNSIAPDEDILLSQGDINFLIRKAAHFGMYFILGPLVFNGLISSKMSRAKVIYLVLKVT